MKPRSRSWSIVANVIAACASACTPSTSARVPVIDVNAAAPAREGARSHETQSTPKQAQSIPLSWETLATDAQARARREGRPLLIFFHADWAATSVELERKVWTDPRVATAARGFVTLKVDLSDAEGVGAYWAEHFHVDRVPTTRIVDSTGKVEKELSGMFSVEQLLPFLEDAR